MKNGRPAKIEKYERRASVRQSNVRPNYRVFFSPSGIDTEGTSEMRDEMTMYALKPIVSLPGALRQTKAMYEMRNIHGGRSTDGDHAGPVCKNVPDITEQVISFLKVPINSVIPATPRDAWPLSYCRKRTPVLTRLSCMVSASLSSVPGLLCMTPPKISTSTNHDRPGIWFCQA